MTMTQSIGAELRTVVVCDDRPELREAIVMVLGEARRFLVVGEAADGLSCLQRLGELHPDVLILDVGMPGGGPQTARTAREQYPGLCIVVFSGRRDRRMQREMLAAGADEYVVKTGRLQPLIAALDRCNHQCRTGAVGVGITVNPIISQKPAAPGGGS